MWKLATPSDSRQPKPSISSLRAVRGETRVEAKYVSGLELWPVQTCAALASIVRACVAVCVWRPLRHGQDINCQKSYCVVVQNGNDHVSIHLGQPRHESHLMHIHQSLSPFSSHASTRLCGRACFSALLNLASIPGLRRVPLHIWDWSTVSADARNMFQTKKLISEGGVVTHPTKCRLRVRATFQAHCSPDVWRTLRTNFNRKRSSSLPASILRCPFAWVLCPDPRLLRSGAFYLTYHTLNGRCASLPMRVA
ncbi:hypothetical protein K437DRAFT_86143 [Tilletiaria anomala UBC 951]|uniref:Uncharacterized protein n=1 Tax=Tilletiaria anomala (strain ATCC 24038 / CBS 436.72 / UBC 951) TaxID=1037660 RepID=A0A066W7E9_TILAU|nr:uncharacterized protein K437DRAFT_86143 [Tilletiaria anomala UBC 951]KDN48458.1 hypothetical protein K437DRAFT_86143 [Tilletiaria anomala UBC 951]